VAGAPSFRGFFAKGWDTTNPNASGPNHQLNPAPFFWRGQAEGGCRTAGARRWLGHRFTAHRLKVQLVRLAVHVDPNMRAVQHLAVQDLDRQRIRSSESPEDS